MKILFFSDMHGDIAVISSLKAKAKDMDICVCAGDFTTMERNIKETMKSLNSFGKRLLLIHGNHEDEARVKELSSKYSNITFLHKGVHHINDYVFLGYGGDGFSDTDPDFVKVANNFFKKEVQGKRRIILITHGPAYDTKIDVLGKMPRGNRSYRQFIDDVKPHLAISGHLHENAGKHHKMGRTLLINPGKTGIIVEI